MALDLGRRGSSLERRWLRLFDAYQQAISKELPLLYYGPVRGWLRGQVHDWEDMAQDCMLLILRALKKHKGEAEIRRFVLRAVDWGIRDRLRRTEASKRPPPDQRISMRQFELRFYARNIGRMIRLARVSIAA